MKRFLILFLIVVFCSCFSKTNMRLDPYYNSFYKVTRLIMSSQEIKIYKHLSDRESKAMFINDFWKKRDPSPAFPEENPAFIEFQRRVMYANRMFKVDSKEGWYTDRGRILIMLGHPTDCFYDNFKIEDQMRNYKSEIGKRLYRIRWVYYQYNFINVVFERLGDFGEYRLVNWSPQLLTAIQKSQLLVDTDIGDDLNKSFVFKVKYNEEIGGLEIIIPVNVVEFREVNPFVVEIKIEFTIDVYKNYEKYWELVGRATIPKKKEDVLNSEYYTFIIPITNKMPIEKGKFLFDMTLKDKYSDKEFSGKYRKFIKVKFK